MSAFDPKQAAVDFMRLVTAGRVDEAYDKHVDMEGRHHNPYFPAGFAALREGMKVSHAQFPRKTFQLRHAVADGDLVAVHSSLSMAPTGPHLIAFHLFRFQRERIVELWDSPHPLPDDSPNVDGPF